jgi:hypothetical protein
MTNETIMIHDVATDEIIIRELTDDEQTLRDAEITAWENAKAEAEEQAEAAKKAAEAKLAALGLTTDDLKALGLGGN